MAHHDLDPYPIPKDKSPLYVNEPWLIDPSHPSGRYISKEPEQQDDNVRVYIPLDLNGNAILRRLDEIISRFGGASEENEMAYQIAVEVLISQIEIYDQIWYVRHMPPEEENHSAEAVELVKRFIGRLEDIPDECAEMFPFETIDALKTEYLQAGGEVN
ncbi:MAG: hypothetical protein IJP92_16320 [Lachnospiraceae bacterium]|nr:hypothetical protein [Lachnospiraceae bacterium]